MENFITGVNRFGHGQRALTRAGAMTPHTQTERPPGVECSAIVGRVGSHLACMTGGSGSPCFTVISRGLSNRHKQMAARSQMPCSTQTRSRRVLHQLTSGSVKKATPIERTAHSTERVVNASAFGRVVTRISRDFSDGGTICIRSIVLVRPTTSLSQQPPGSQAPAKPGSNEFSKAVADGKGGGCWLQGAG